MSREAVNIMAAAVEYADSQMDTHTFVRLTDEQIDRRYAEWLVEFIYDHGWQLTPEAL